MKAIKLFILIILIISIVAGCASSSKNRGNKKDSFVKGADIGWLQQMEATGYKFYGNDGTEQDCFKILKDHGINTVRLRTWVNPNNNKASGHNNKAETVDMAVRAKKWGMRVMI